MSLGSCCWSWSACDVPFCARVSTKRRATSTDAARACQCVPFCWQCSAPSCRLRVQTRWSRSSLNANRGAVALLVDTLFGDVRPPPMFDVDTLASLVSQGRYQAHAVDARCRRARRCAVGAEMHRALSRRRAGANVNAAGAGRQVDAVPLRPCAVLEPRRVRAAGGRLRRRSLALAVRNGRLSSNKVGVHSQAINLSLLQRGQPSRR